MPQSKAFAPQAFGPYRLREPIAEGGMAEVFLAEDAAGRTVALKRILPGHPERNALARMLLEEARLASALSHRNVVRVLDAGQVGGEPYIAMEYVAGESLARLIDRTRERGRLLPEPLACHVAMEMCRGLAHAHALADAAGNPLGLVHRDISPQNVLVAYTGEVKVVDFGIAKAYAAQSPRRENTRTGVVKGKYLYFSPEQVRSRALDGRTDVFATGVVLYEMLCGRLPYDGDMAKVLFRIVYGELSRPGVWRPALAPELEAIVLLAMATDRERRFPTARSLGDALGGFLARAAPEFDRSGVSEVMRGLFQEEIAARGLGLPPSSGFAAELETWQQVPGDPQARVSTLESTAPARVQAMDTARRTLDATSPQVATGEPAEDILHLEAPRLVLEGRWAGREFACIRTVLSVGRSANADICIDDASLSELHARLVYEGGAWRALAEPGSALRVNGAPVRDGRISPGDRLELGEVVARFLDPEDFPTRRSRSRAWLWVTVVLGAALLGAWVGLRRLG